MTSGADDDILDDLFHGGAFAAYVELAFEQQGPPDMEATRKRAYVYFEEELARRDAALPAATQATAMP
jgi:hypothetical protein